MGRSDDKTATRQQFQVHGGPFDELRQVSFIVIIYSMFGDGIGMAGVCWTIGFLCTIHVQNFVPESRTCVSNTYVVNFALTIY